jgi:hypothetical protein
VNDGVNRGLIIGICVLILLILVAAALAFTWNREPGDAGQVDDRQTLSLRTDRPEPTIHGTRAA